MRIVTLLPAATEIVMALGGADALVGVSHECDYPRSVCDLPRVTSTPIDPTLPGARIDGEVRRLHDAGLPVVSVDAATLRSLAPDAVLTQDLCEVCAVRDGDVHRLAAVLDPAPAIIGLSARTLDGIWDDIRAVARLLDLASDGDELVAGLRHRLDRLGARAAGPPPRVVCIEWLDPLYLAGHWVPDLVASAGGRDIAAVAGTHSTRTSWERLRDLQPDLIVVMLCGFDVARSRAELALLDRDGAAWFLESAPVWIIDGNAYTSRPGPRVVDGAERLRAAIEGRSMPGLERWVAA